MHAELTGPLDGRSGSRASTVPDSAQLPGRQNIGSRDSARRQRSFAVCATYRPGAAVAQRDLSM